MKIGRAAPDLAAAWGSAHNARMPRPDAVLLDLDCTLTDRRATIVAFAEVFVCHFGDALRVDAPAGASASGRPRLADDAAAALVAADGNGYRPRAEVFAHLRRVLPWVAPPAPGVVEAFWARAFPDATRAADGLAETLGGLRERGVRLGVVSNGGAAAQQRKVDALGIRPLLSTVVISGAVGVRKPARRIFEIALEQIGAAAADTWFVGDHPAYDVLGARAAGLTPVWRRGVHPWPAAHARPALQIDRLPDLLHLLDEAAVMRPVRIPTP